MHHWTEELFKEKPQLFLKILQELNPQARAEIKDILSLLDLHGHEPRRILDLNCGIGRHSIELGKRGIDVLGTDISTAYIDIATKRAQKLNVDDKVRFKVIDMRQIESVLNVDESFDGILCLWTSFGFYDDDTNEDILKQCLHLVKPGGFFALDIVNRDWLLRNFSERSFERIKDRLVLYERQFDAQHSRHKDNWTFMKRVDENTFVIDGAVQLDLRVWSIHELIELFERTGWRFENAYHGSPQTRGIRKVRFTLPDNDDLIEAGRLLVISSKPSDAV